MQKLLRTLPLVDPHKVKSMLSDWEVSFGLPVSTIRLEDGHSDEIDNIARDLVRVTGRQIQFAEKIGFPESDRIKGYHSLLDWDVPTTDNFKCGVCLSGVFSSIADAKRVPLYGFGATYYNAMHAMISQIPPSASYIETSVLGKNAGDVEVRRFAFIAEKQGHPLRRLHSASWAGHGL